MDDQQRCTAMLSSGVRRCKKARMKGQAVCGHHGGKSPQAKASAQERLMAALDPAVSKLIALLDNADPRVAIRACQMVLDRAGLAPPSQLETVDLKSLSDDQLQRLAAGEPLLRVLSSGPGAFGPALDAPLLGPPPVPPPAAEDEEEDTIDVDDSGTATL